MPLKAVSVWETKKRYSGEEKGFVEEMRFVAMKLHTRDQAKEGEKEDPDVQPLAKWEPSIEGYIRFLVDSKVVYDTLESIVNEAAYPVYAEFRNTGLERSEKLSKDLEWFKEQGHAIPEPSSPGTSYASYLKELSEKVPPAFICHFYNVYFAHTAGGRMIGKKVAGKILDSKQLEFYKWDGDFSQLLQNAREKLNRVTQEILNILIILCSTSLVLAQLEPNENPVFDVVNYGAVGDGKTDDSQAFTKAWAAMCTARGALPTISFPPGKTFLLKPIALSGPCASPHVHVQVSGNLVGPSTVAEWQDATEWLRFTHVEGLTVDGSGLIGGQGPMWWPCRTKPHVTCQKPAPTALYFGFCNGLRLNGLHLHNNPRNHISLLACNGGVVSNLAITAPGDSPNTDGIDIQDTEDLQIYNSTIATGDDCIAILNNTINVNISYVTCGPGHGISIGSLGKEGGLAIVEQIHLFHCTFKDTTNGARIKTWEKGTGYVRDITYQDLIMDRVQNPIIIDQTYNPNPTLTTDSSQIKVSGVQFNGVRGTSSVQQAVKMECSPAAPCTDVVLEDVSMTNATPGQKLTSEIFNARGKACCNCNPPVFC